MKLHLVLKHKWFDMIAAGVKKEEYRDQSDYWESRIWVNRFDITSIIFHRGYSSQTVEVECTGVYIGPGKPEWGYKPYTEPYILRLGKIIQKIK